MQHEKIWRIWVELENPRQQIPAYALPQTIKQEGDRITCQFQQCPQVSAMLQGFRFKMGNAISRLFEATLGGTSGVLKPLGSGYSIDENDLRECSFLAYYLPDEGKNAHTVAIVEENELGGRDRISLAPGGKIQATPNLVGKTVKLQCTYPSSVVTTNERFDTLYVHLVGQVEGKVQYSGWTGCKVEDVRGKMLHLKLARQDKAFRLHL